MDAVGETLAASNTPLPEAVPATGIAAPFTVAASVVVVGEVTMKLRLEEVLALKAVAEVGAKTAVSTSVPIANVVVGMLHVPEARVHAVPTVADPLLN